ncbi:MAG: molecular chaperone HtpG [Deltaproteobacteria bacterium]|nr:molecular chaperone HtpG [Deltaproteobacteria bacterium]
MAETRSFQAQTNKLLDLMIHSIYAHKDVFLRELVSNASDAIDKVRFLALTDSELLEGDGEFKIKIIADADKHTLTILDNGIGMTYDEVIDHIGTIARSGAETFAERTKGTAADAATPDLIGQFGVGFYSAFMVAKRVLLETCKAKADHAVRWESAGDGTYTIERLDKTRRGTRITLFLRDKDAPKDDAAMTADGAEGDGGDDGDTVFNADNWTDAWTIRRTIKKYSDFIAFPIVMDTKKYESEVDEDGEAVEGAERKEKIVEETLNSTKALWTRPATTIEADEHKAFYKHLSRDWNDPAETIHFHIEGSQEWTALLYVPEKAPFDLFSREPRRGLQLYIKRVFIAEDVKELIPEHLRFLKGLVDSADLPLNMSRETVQQDRLVGAIKKRVTNKVVAHFKDMLAQRRDAYVQLWDEFGTCLKEGFHYEPAGKDKLADIVLVRTTHGDGWSTLGEVVERKQAGQTALYYLTGEKLETLQSAPQLEVFRKRNIEVILLPEAVDEIMVGALDKYQDLELKSAAKGELDGLPETEDEAKAKQARSEEFAVLTDRLGKLLDESCKQVRISDRLTDSAVCLVSDSAGMSPQMERMMMAMGQSMPTQKRILELNPDHTLIQAMRDLAAKDSGDDRLQEFAEMLFDQALLAEGAPIKNPAKFAQRVASAMTYAVAH